MSQEPSPATVGDPLPHLILPNSEGVGISLGHQNRAGRWQVLLFLDPADVPARVEALLAARERLNGIEAYIYLIALSGPDASLPGADMFDESGKGAAFLLGMPNPGIAVIAPTGCLSAQLAADDLDAAIMHCKAHASAFTNNVQKGTAPVLVMENLFEPELCQRVVQYWQDNPKTTGGVASSAHGNDQEIASIKRRQDVVIPDGPLFEEIKGKIARRVLPQIIRAYQMQIVSMEALRIGEYNASDAGAFGRHRDNATQFTAHRRLALTVNLNTGEYGGGELRFPEFGPGLYQPPVGGGVVFSCGMLHEALPVNRGSRFGMFTFFTDAAGLEQEKQMHERMKAEQAAQQSQA